ncbi:ABC transporter ATP-binding protein [Candidatus Aminicenantes bacterium AC-708-M15]|jgi:ABC-2 type transport system ATP-binding protein|nr:ABC transporter ATP-binding protein [SCandidatus Aminicenantes bacterium Aminicenantia_JdfR_composite]MCP2596380.1 ABC transporter ATP-binding protein [Candidatus Aminicenantes bacterium AC-335-G13]MCP2598565.1 ABC transporter ATP-binding protein [Candidatus Aminicenantes bacterium AC-335-L06]MCP2604091.1 ABC transporter ATP-binding protein [Candidatus Aminicenantes bacterium AC-708-M15]MCP2605380.1 ABC transporter ATP-binding protein [Candidatus Aminicenantes bacterium AC-335-O07]MCP260600
MIWNNQVAIEIENLHKIFKRGLFRPQVIHALKGINLKIKKGEIFCLLGPNGAGKTTLLNILSLLLYPDKGKIKIFNQDISKKENFLKARLNLCSGNPNFPWTLTVYEILNFYGKLYGLRGKKLKKRIAKYCELLEIKNFLNRRFEELSTGTKQRLALAKSLLNEPELLFLDEPTAGLDPDIALKIRNIIKKIHSEKKPTIILTTHYMAEAEMLAERIAFIKDGEILAEGTPQGLKEKLSANNLEEVFLELVK